MEMQYSWIVDQVSQEQFTVQWYPSQENDADFFTKHHLAAQHHTRIRPYYHYYGQFPILSPRATPPSVMQGYIGTNTHGYGNHTPLPMLPVKHDTWATKLM